MTNSEYETAQTLAARFQDALIEHTQSADHTDCALYAVSDIHGCDDAFCDALKLIDLRDADSKLILCGDYIDSRHERPEFLTAIRLFQEANAEQVVVLKGNHEVAFLDEIKDYVACVDGGEVLYSGNPEMSLLNDAATISWLRKLPTYYETEKQIFVHAGIDEEAGDLWKVGTPEYFFYQKFPQSYGSFEKDIIAGHVGTETMCGENRVFWDGESHYYLDGTTEKSNIVPVLEYQVQADTYSTWIKENDTWIKMPVKNTDYSVALL